VGFVGAARFAAFALGAFRAVEPDRRVVALIRQDDPQGSPTRLAAQSELSSDNRESCCSRTCSAFEPSHQGGVMRIPPRAVALIGIGLLLAVVVLLRERPAQAEAVPDVLRAQAIELVDSRGRVRAQLNVSPDGEAVFRLRDANGVIRIKLGADEAGSGLLLANERTEPGVHILATRTRTSLTLQRGAQRRVLRP
jgi:hypothetical protein